MSSRGVARRRGSPLRGLVIFVLVGALLGAALFFGDRWARQQAEDAVATQLQAKLATPQRPKVDIPGFPFITQALLGTIRSVHVVADGAGTTTDAPLQIRHVDLQLHDVTSPDGFQTMKAAAVDGRAELDLAALRGIITTPVTYAGGGRVSVETHSSVLGTDVVAVVTGRPALDARAQTVTLADPTVQVAGVDLPATAARLIIEAIVKPVPVAGIPYGLRLSSLVLDDAGITATLTGENIAFAR